MKAAIKSPLVTLYKTLIDSWNRQDAKAMASLYAAQGGQIGFDGSQVSGARNIEKHLSPIFRDHPTARFVFSVQKVRKFDDTVGMVEAIAGMVPRNDSEIDPSKNTVQTMWARKSRGKWRVELFQNTPARLDGRPEQVEAMTKTLQKLVKIQLETKSNRV